jgi:DNA-binding NarL/FixJ family response regulator
MILLVESARLTRESLASLIRSRGADLRVEMLPSMMDAPGDVPGVPDVVVVNAKSQDLGDPQLEAGAVHLQRIWPGVPRLLISEQNGESAVALRAIRLGWHGFFPAALDIDLLIAAVRLVCVQGLFIPPAAVQDCAMQAPAAVSPGHLAGAGI